MKQDSTLFPKIVIGSIAASVFAAWLFGLPEIIAPEAARQGAEKAFLPYILLVDGLALVAAFFFGLFQAYQLLAGGSGSNIDSESSARAWKNLKFSAMMIGGLMLVGMAALMALAAGKGEDLTGIIAPALLIAILSGAVATFAAIFQGRAQKAISLKTV